MLHNFVTMKVVISDNWLCSIGEIDLDKYRRILLVGGVGTGKTMRAKEMIVKVKKSDPNVNVLVISTTKEYKGIAEELNMRYVEPTQLGLDPIKLYRANMLGYTELKRFVKDYIGLEKAELDKLGSINEIDRSDVYEGEMVDLRGDMVLSLNNFHWRDLYKAGFLIARILMNKMVLENMTNTLLVVDSMDKFLNGSDATDLMKLSGKMGNIFVGVVGSLYQFGNDIVDVLSVSDMVLIFKILDTMELSIIKDFFRLDEETINDIRELEIGEYFPIDNRKRREKFLS